MIKEQAFVGTDGMKKINSYGRGGCYIGIR